MDVLNELATKFPEDEELLREMGELFQNKQYHQLTVQLLEYVQREQFESGTDLIDLYNGFVSNFEKNINKLSLAQITVPVSKQYEDTNEAIAFLTNVQDKVADKRQPFLFLDMQLAQLKLELDDAAGCRNALDDCRKFVQSSSGVDNAISANFYLTSSKYYRHVGKPSQFYRDSLLYLAFVDLEGMPLHRHQEIARDLAVAALVSDSIYNFGELLLHPVLDTLADTENSWLVDALKAFNAGNIEQFDSLTDSLKGMLDDHAQGLAAGGSLDALREKILLLALLELVFQRDRSQWLLSFAEIADTTQQGVSDVEWLLMRALSLKLIKGVIDEVDQTVHITWIQPRVLNKSQITVMTERIAKWADNTKQTLLFVEESAEPLK